MELQEEIQNKDIEGELQLQDGVEKEVYNPEELRKGVLDLVQCVDPSLLSSSSTSTTPTSTTTSTSTSTFTLTLSSPITTQEIEKVASLQKQEVFLRNELKQGILFYQKLPLSIQYKLANLVSLDAKLDSAENIVKGL